MGCGASTSANVGAKGQLEAHPLNTKLAKQREKNVKGLPHFALANAALDHNFALTAFRDARVAEKHHYVDLQAFMLDRVDNGAEYNLREVCATLVNLDEASRPVDEMFLAAGARYTAQLEALLKRFQKQDQLEKELEQALDRREAAKAELAKHEDKIDKARQKPGFAALEGKLRLQTTLLHTKIKECEEQRARATKARNENLAELTSAKRVLVRQALEGHIKALETYHRDSLTLVAQAKLAVESIVVDEAMVANLKAQAAMAQSMAGVAAEAGDEGDAPATRKGTLTVPPPRSAVAPGSPRASAVIVTVTDPTPASPVEKTSPAAPTAAAESLDTPQAAGSKRDSLVVPEPAAAVVVPINKLSPPPSPKPAQHAPEAASTPPASPRASVASTSSGRLSPARPQSLPAIQRPVPTDEKAAPAPASPAEPTLTSSSSSAVASEPSRAATSGGNDSEEDEALNG